MYLRSVMVLACAALVASQACTGPGPVRDIQVLYSDSSRIMVQWLAPLDNGCPRSGFRYCLTDLDSGAELSCHTINTFTYTSNGLSSCTWYLIEVTTLGQVGYLDSSTERLNETTSTSDIPDPVTDLQVTHLNTYDISVRWSRPSNTNCDLSYTICWNDSGATDAEVCRATGITSDSTPSINITALNSCTDYDIRVASVDGGGKMSDNASVTVRTPGSARSLKSLSTSDVTSSSFTVNWEISDDSLRCGHTLDVCTTRVATADKYCVLGTPGDRWERKGLAACSLYHVDAVLVVGLHVFSPVNHSVVTTRAGNTMIASAQVVNVNSSEISISWVPVYPRSPCALGYQVCWGAIGVTNPTCRTDVSRDVTEFTVTGLQSGTSYNLQVMAMFEGNQVSLPYLLSATTAVGSPVTSLRVTSVNTYNFEVQWTCLTSPSCTLDYEICWTDLSSSNSSGCTPTGEISDSTPSFIIPGLNSCTDYNITVSTTTAGGTFFETSVLARTPATARSLRSLTASEVLDSSFVLNWEILDDSVRCGHALDICATSTVSNDRYCSLNATGNQWQVTGLQPCSRYNVGATLTVDSQVLPPKNLSVFTASYNSTMIQSAQVVSVSTSEISISWIPVYPGSPCALGYRVCWGVKGADVSLQICRSNLSTDATSFTITQLQSDTNYDITLEAWLGGSVFSEQWSSDALTNVGSPVTSLRVTSVNTYNFEVQWTCLTSPSCTLDYEICWTDLSSSNSSGCTPTGEISDSTPSFIIPGLNSCTDYNITISTTTAGGTFFEAFVLARTPATARSLRSLTASEVLDSSFVLNWEILDDSARCGHALDICATSTVSNDRYCSLNATGNQWQVTGLQPCSRYNVGATLTVDSQVLPPKNLSVFTASYNSTMIQSAQVVSVSTSEISISWIPVYPGSPCALGYRVCWGVKGADVSLQICRSNLSTDATSFTITQLQSDTNYDITLEAWLGGSVFSEQWSSDALTNVGSPVTSLRVTSVNTYNFEVQWTCLTSPSCTLDYEICWTDLSSSNSSGCTSTGEISDSTPSFIIPGLNSCTDYNITVSTTAAGGTFFETSVLARTPLSAESLRSLSAASVTNTSFVVQWEIPENSARCGYSLDICASSLYTNHKYCTSNATGTKWERVGLEACSLYDVTATLSVGHHVLPPVYISVATSRPNDTMLESVSVADMTRNNISVSWVPIYPGLPCSLGYQVCWGVAGVDPTIQACSSDLPRDARNFTIAGLRRRTNYTVQVMARFDGDVMSPPVQLVALTAGAGRAALFFFGPLLLIVYLVI